MLRLISRLAVINKTHFHDKDKFPAYKVLHKRACFEKPNIDILVQHHSTYFEQVETSITCLRGRWGNICYGVVNKPSTRYHLTKSEKLMVLKRTKRNNK